MSPNTRFELREAADGTLRLSGLACATGVSYPVGFYEETVAPGSFKRALANPALDCQLVVGHAGLPLARTTSGTLRLREDSSGLVVDADLDAQDAEVQSIARKIRRGDVTDMSFGFKVIQQEWNDDYSRRLIQAVELHKGDVSIVGYGANDATSVDIRTRGTIGEARGEQTNLPYEERRRRADDIGKRATGGGRISRSDSNGDCSRCHGNGSINIACPTCSKPARSMVPEYIPNYTVRARSRYEAIRFPKR